MNSAKNTVFALAIVAGFALPNIAHASSVWHAANTEAGVTYYPEHFKSTKTRAQVTAETAAARNDGTFDRFQAQYQFNEPVPAKDAGPGKTREQVVAELNSETADERKARMNLLAGS